MTPYRPKFPHFNKESGLSVVGSRLLPVSWECAHRARQPCPYCKISCPAPLLLRVRAPWRYHRVRFLVPMFAPRVARVGGVV